MSEAETPDYAGMAHEEIAHLNGKRGLGGELEAVEAELREVLGEGGS